MTPRHALEAEIAAQQAILDDKRNRLAAMLREEMKPLRRPITRMERTFHADLATVKAGRTVVYTYQRRDVGRLSPPPIGVGKTACHVPPSAPRVAVAQVRAATAALTRALSAEIPVALTLYGRAAAVLVPLERP